MTDQLDSTVSKKFKIKILGLLGVTTTSLKTGKVGKKYNAALKAAWGKQPYAWSLVSGSLPTGLFLNSLTGAITGIPTASGPFDFTVQVADPLGGTARKNFTFTIN